MNRYWFHIVLSNGIEVTHQVQASNKPDAKRKARQKVKKLFPRKKINFDSVNVKRV